MAVTTKIRISATEGVGIQIACSQNGRKVDMTIPSNIANVAGMLAEVSCRMLGYNNEHLIKKKDDEERID